MPDAPATPGNLSGMKSAGLRTTAWNKHIRETEKAMQDVADPLYEPKKPKRKGKRNVKRREH